MVMKTRVGIKYLKYICTSTLVHTFKKCVPFIIPNGGTVFFRRKDRRTSIFLLWKSQLTVVSLDTF